MTVHPQLSNPNAVLISRTPVGEPVTWMDFHRAAVQVLTAMRIGLEGEHVVLKPNLSSGRRSRTRTLASRRIRGSCRA